ncbi:hypothetical protein AB5N19_08996 [Seiridium cardinale]
MASTTAGYQVDKEQQQLSGWPDNEELDIMTSSGNFFDEYVTFDPNDFLKDPQSPSAILDSLDDDLTNSSNDQDTLPVPPFTEDATSFAAQTSVAEQVDSLPIFQAQADPVLGVAGSISDFELLRLEGISLKSPGEPVRAPLSPPLLSQSSPTKRSRFVDSVYATVRRATHRSKPTGTNISTAAMDVFKKGPEPRHHFTNQYDYTINRLDLKPEPIDSNGLPLSPPLTGKIPHSGSYSSKAPFVTGNLDDPFFEDFMSLPVTTHNPSTPINTPALKDELFFPSGVPAIPQNTTQILQPKQRNTSSAEWPVAGIIGDDSSRHWTLTGSSSYMPDDNALQSPSWWEDPSTPSTHAHPVSEHNGTVRNSAASFNHNHAIHQLQSELPYEYTSDLSGLMIHMPQPRQPQAAVLTANIPEQLMTPTHRSRSSQHSHHNRGHYTEHHQQHRRPKPRAPSSGARHHHGSMTSPRKPSLHHSSSRGMLIHREQSVSPSPSAHRLQRAMSSSNISIRKQRSWSRAPRTPNPGSHSGSHPFSGGGCSPLGGDGGGGGGGGGGIDFVNFTPGDKNVLMTGVAPSGSSKTKARREKEAADRRRRLSEAAVKAVQAAGGDIDKLVREGFAI